MKTISLRSLIGKGFKCLMVFAFFGMGLNQMVAQVEDEDIFFETDTIDLDGSVEKVKDTWQSARITDDMTVDSEQNKNWRMGDYKFSAKPKNAWELGLHGGHFFIDGDVDRTVPGGWGAGLHLRKAINYVFSIRGDLFYGRAYGLDPQAWRHRDAKIGGSDNGGGLVEEVFDPYAPRQGDNSYEEWFPRHRTTYIYGALQGVVNVGNLLFHKERNKWNFNVAAGPGLDHHNTMLDLLDADGGIYTNLKSRIGWTRAKFDTKAGRVEIRKDLKATYDGEYETAGYKKKGIFRIGDDTNIHVVFVTSMGVARKLGKRVNLGLEHQVMVSDNDYLDGIKFRTSEDQTNNADLSHYTNLRLGINLGNFDKVTEPLYWLNPIDGVMNDIAGLKQRPELDLSDEDEDGVIDMLDQQLDSEPGCDVDTRGITLDSDGDGIVDCKDCEPFSPPGYEVSECGKADVPTECCMDESTVRNIVKDEARSFKTVNTTTTTPRSTTNTIIKSGCGDWYLPMIHYDLAKSNIKPEYTSHMHHIATVMKKCPELCVVAHGHTDNRNNNDYNTKLSFERASNAANYLVTEYGIDRSRIKVMYGGEERPLIPSPTNEADHYMNRRVEFRTCDGTDFNMSAPAGASTAPSNNVQSGEVIRDYYNGNKNSGY